MGDTQMPNIDDILSSLSPEDMESLKEAARNILGDEPKQADTGGGGGMPDFADILGNAEMMAKISAIMSAMNKTDSRSNLIAALKPLLSEPRRKKADEAMQLLKLMDIMPLLQNSFGQKGD